MAKSRNEVQQLGMWDDEVGSVKHDEICLWAYRHADEILRSVMPDLFDRPWDLTAEVGIPSQEFSVAPARPLLDEFLAKNWRPNPRVVAKSIEPVLSYRTGHRDAYERIVGYGDLLVELEIPFIGPIYQGRPYDELVGFKTVWQGKHLSPAMLIEAKSVLPTLGELMRQINLYRRAFRGSVVVVSPDDRYASILEEQGVAFVKYEPDIESDAQ